jgi:hypothetical protein
VVLQPGIQFGTAIHGESFSGGALNGIQKPLHVGNPFSVQHKKNVFTVWILANWADAAGVAAVTCA